MNQTYQNLFIYIVTGTDKVYLGGWYKFSVDKTLYYLYIFIFFEKNVYTVMLNPF